MPREKPRLISRTNRACGGRDPSRRVGRWGHGTRRRARARCRVSCRASSCRCCYVWNFALRWPENTAPSAVRRTCGSNDDGDPRRRRRRWSSPYRARIWSASRGIPVVVDVVGGVFLRSQLSHSCHRERPHRWYHRGHRRGNSRLADSPFLRNRVRSGRSLGKAALLPQTDTSALLFHVMRARCSREYDDARC